MRAKDIRKGNVVMYNNAPHRVAESIHRTPGNLRAFVQMKLRNLINNAMVDQRFSSDDDLEFADISTFKATFLYSDDSGYHFMNSENYEQVALTDELIGDSKFYLTEGLAVQVSLLGETPIGIELPKTVDLEVIETVPGMAGATATNSGKPATLSTGLTVTVPQFVKNGERVTVDTEEGKYLSRAEKN